MKRLFILFATISCALSYSQIDFQKGYYFENSGEKTECLIKNLQWLNNPTKFTYKLTEDAPQNDISIEQVSEFGVYGDCKYVRKTVNIDQSNNKIGNLTDNRNPTFVEKTLFLEVLVEGKANLYYYNSNELEKYFFKPENSEIEQLVYIRYFPDENRITVAENNKYKTQLWNTMKCPSFSIKEVENLNYKNQSLVDFFKKYNACFEPNTKGATVATTFVKKERTAKFNLSAKAGISYSSLMITLSDGKSLEFGNKVSGRFGVEGELLLPFNKKKWSVFFDPAYKYYKNETSLAVFGGTAYPTVDYKAIEIPLGMRHYFFLNDASKLFLEGLLIYDYDLNSIVTVSQTYSLEANSSLGFGFGVGYKFKESFSVALRYNTNKDIMSEYSFMSSSFKNSSIIFGYTLF